MACLVASRGLYNEMLERQKAHYAETGRFISQYALTAAFKGRGGVAVPATVVQSLAKRLDTALHRYLARRSLEHACGFPRFKGANRWHSVHLRQYGRGDDAFVDNSGRLRLAAKLGGAVKLKQHRPLEGTPKTAHLVLRADGHWYVLIVCEQPPAAPAPTQAVLLEPSQPVVGLDVGLHHFLADSDGRTVANPQHFRQAERALRRQQRALSRRKAGSRRRRTAARLVARTHLKVARQRRDFQFKTAREYAERYARIYVEDLNIAGMVKNHRLAKRIHDASWGAFLDVLQDKAESAGHAVVRVPAHSTSQRCSRCGEVVPKTLSVRTHVCAHCGYLDDRDINAARNILQRGLSLEAADSADTAGAQPSSQNRDAGPGAARSRRH
jgi:putative transposase